MINFELDKSDYKEIEEFNILRYNELLSDDIKKLIYFFNEEYNWDDIKVDFCNFYNSGRVQTFHNKLLGKNIFKIETNYVVKNL
jgi:hypothetical protein